MTGELENSVCPTCGGKLQRNLATIPFVLEPDTVIVIKGVPAETCLDCHEPFVAGQAADRVTALLRQLKALRSEVSVVAYAEPLAA
jgi:YgiT-type zinc finger domain-containing protein